MHFQCPDAAGNYAKQLGSFELFQIDNFEHAHIPEDALLRQSIHFGALPQLKG